jgi:hypothetical protein
LNLSVRLAIITSTGRNNMSVITSDGDIPYRKVTIGTLIFEAPVRVTKVYNPNNHLPGALRTAQGDLIYALPGGMYLLPDGAVYDPNARVYA